MANVVVDERARWRFDASEGIGGGSIRRPRHGGCRDGAAFDEKLQQAKMGALLIDRLRKERQGPRRGWLALKLHKRGVAPPKPIKGDGVGVRAARGEQRAGEKRVAFDAVLVDIGAAGGR